MGYVEYVEYVGYVGYVPYEREGAVIFTSGAELLLRLQPSPDPIIAAVADGKECNEPMGRS